ncbi:MAG: adenosylcobinamide-GDP ribazoletransferase, partial [Acidobacteriota bacterium]
GQYALAVVTALPFLLWIGAVAPVRTAAAIVTAALVGFVFLRHLKRRLGGVTGDCLGALCYIGQVVFLLALAADPAAASPPVPPQVPWTTGLLGP